MKVLPGRGSYADWGPTRTGQCAPTVFAVLRCWRQCADTLRSLLGGKLEFDGGVETASEFTNLLFDPGNGNEGIFASGVGLKENVVVKLDCRPFGKIGKQDRADAGACGFVALNQFRIAIYQGPTRDDPGASKRRVHERGVTALDNQAFGNDFDNLAANTTTAVDAGSADVRRALVASANNGLIGSRRGNVGLGQGGKRRWEQDEQQETNDE